ncbi:HoxN/HupN/NixA family nickel/cobalt transporter [Telmatospirillum siberiense]|uniref:Nickel/cobalt efflux system n=1 Tax=Telmatospirillum siberiense TaxID=382514 RepID=A0A2N3PUY7_9PROT|nr:HoxN/HupN/NixA family nickel/cobalt transporter [Telmatospirillum siberiense]PKU24207.1 HoxN/HupN/NixA family nickel/cobalt transporter [Telmatospirillum siberiense]
MFSRLLHDAPGGLRRRLIGLYGLLAVANLLTWGWALIAFRDYPVLLGTALLAYSFGLRHAVDADHIAAIDNVTRKLMQEGKRPVAVGFFFSLGHSSVVVGLSVAIAATAVALQGRFSEFKEMGGIIGTSVSAFFLFAIAIANMIVLAAVYKSFRAVRRGERYVDEDIDLLLANRGFLGRLFRRLFRLISKSWHMYPLGLLFGLGFDTATEVGLLGISAAEASRGLPIWSILVFPALFTAGMSLVDTLDSTLMVGAYDWAFIKPIRKLYYNMTITLVSVLIAVLVGGLETLGLLADKLSLEGPFWELIGQINDNFGVMGFAIVGIFAASWLVSIAIYRWKGYDEIEVTA